MAKKRKNEASSLKFSHIFLILIFVAGVTFLCLSIFAPAKKNPDEESLSTTVNETEKKEEEETGRGGEEKNDGTENPDKTPKQNEDEPETDSTKISASITKNEIENGTYKLRVTIYELLSSGTCKLHMESSQGDSLDRTAKIVNAGPDSSSCEGFDITNVKNYLSIGTYEFSVVMTSGSKTGSVKGTIKIE